MTQRTPDDDHTIDADPAALDRIRELAAAAERRPDARPDDDCPDDATPIDAAAHDDDHTIDADPSTPTHLRQLARDAHGADDDDRTLDADPAALDELRRRTDAVGGPRRSGASRPMPRLPIPEVDARPPARPVRRTDAAEPWRPPARSMRPERVVHAPVDHGARWRLVSIVLAAVLVVTIGWLVLGGDDQPVDESPPEPTTATTSSGSTAPSAVTPGSQEDVDG